MSHKTRVERHIVVDVLAGVLGASFVTAFTAKSYLALILAVAAGVVLFLLERNNIQEEDQLEAAPEFEVIEAEAENLLSEADMGLLREWAKYPPSNNIPPEGNIFYTAGLRDGAAIASDWVLKTIGDSE